jgi:hypothetical protein
LHDKTYTYEYDSSKMLTHGYKEEYQGGTYLGVEYDLANILAAKV